MEEELDFKKETLKASLFSIIGNTILALLKGTAGVIGHSYALIADAIESTTDIISSIIVMFGVQYALKKPNKLHPYGYGKIEPILTIMVGALLFTSGCIIAYHSIDNIYIPHKVPSAWTLYVVGPIIIWKEISFQWVMQKAKKTNSSSLKADAWHHRADAITSLSAFIGISISLFFGDKYANADDYAALFAAIFIFYNSYKLVRPAFDEILDKQIYNNITDEVTQIASTLPEIDSIEKCYVRKAGMFYFIDLHARIQKDITVEEGHIRAHHLKKVIEQKIPSVLEVMIHIEPTYSKS